MDGKRWAEEGRECDKVYGVEIRQGNAEGGGRGGKSQMTKYKAQDERTAAARGGGQECPPYNAMAAFFDRLLDNITFPCLAGFVGLPIVAAQHVQTRQPE